MPISAPKPFNKPASAKPIVESTDAPMANPPAAPTPTISFLTMSFNNGDVIFPETVGAPSVLLCIIPYGFLYSFLYCFSNAQLTAPPRL